MTEQKPDKYTLFRTGKAHQCQKRVYSGQRFDFGGHQCSLVAIGQFDGKWLCKKHSPEFIAAKDKALQDKWDAESKARSLRYDIEREQRRITEGLSLEELQALKPERVRASNQMYEALKKISDGNREGRNLIFHWDYVDMRDVLARIEAEEKKQ